MTTKVGFIGGSGVYNFDGIEKVDEIQVDTPFGKPSDLVLKFKFEDHEFFFLSRHGSGHRISPSEINYRANIYALKSLGVRNLVSISAVGSLKEELPPRKVVLPDQFIDWTKGLRERTFFKDGMVGHVSTAYPIETKLQKRIEEVCKNERVDHSKGGSYIMIHTLYSKGGSYICIEGPQFSSRAESELYRSFGASVIGMTNVPEAYLAKEAGIAYATIALITDYDCWKEEHCTVDEIMKVMGDNYKTAQVLVKSLAVSLNKNPVSFEPENQFAVVTNSEFISKENKKIMEVLLAK